MRNQYRRTQIAIACQVTPDQIAAKDRQKRDEIRIHDVVVIRFGIDGQAYDLGCFNARPTAKERLKGLVPVATSSG